jgi:uncharacterized protein YggT (Ycf19 family)
MDELLLRLSVLARVVVPLVLFMAWLYLLLHILFARIVRQADSPLLWFFAVVTGPLTRPVRALLPPNTPEPRVRLVALAVYVALWLVARVGLSGPASPG